LSTLQVELSASAKNMKNFKNKKSPLSLSPYVNLLCR
jgi:hypothetical protein